jgi:uncharacterized lipoprotein YajG
MKAFALAALLLLAGCSTSSEIRYRTVPASLIPDPPVLPTVRADELKCLSDETYAKLVVRDKLRKQHANELRALLETGQ